MVDKKDFLRDDEGDYDPELPPEVYKVIGAPGTGKTTRVVGNPELGLDGLMIENMDEYPLDQQMLVTYTKAGTEEAAERLYKMLDLPKYKIDNRVKTIHSHCYHAVGVEQDQVVGYWEKKNFCDMHGIEFGGDDDEDNMMGGDAEEGNALFRIYGWLKSNCKELEDHDECPVDYPGVSDPYKMMKKWEDFKEERNLIEFTDMIEKTVEMGRMQVENLGLGPLFPDENVSNIEMFEKARYDESRTKDLVDKMRGSGAFVDTKVLYVDEVQDLTPLQWRWYLLQKLVCEKVYIGGDDDQCLPSNAPVEVLDKKLHDIDASPEKKQKPIKDVQVGEYVRTLKSDGEYGYSHVTNVKKQEVVDQRFRTIKTESDNLTAVTDNHKMLAKIPSADEANEDRHYVYLMRDNDGNWRIGETANLRQRMNVERGARAIIPVDSFSSKEEALKKESIWSMKYSIPQLTINQREGEVLSEPDNRDEIYGSINPQYDLIERELGVDLSKPAYFKKATTRGRTESINITIKKCADMRGDEPRHKLSVYTSNDDVIDKLRKIDELNESDGKKNSKRFRTTSTNYTKLGDIASEVQQRCGGDIITELSPTESRDKALIIPAANLVEGMKVPVVKDDEVVWDEIVRINDRTETEEVYDLTVDGTHNFTTNGIAVSNTIYGWAGANPEFMLDEEGDFEVLETTYRIPKQIWEQCDRVIQQVEYRQEKNVEPDGEDGEFITMKRPSANRVAEHLQEGSVYILFRAKYMIEDFCEDLHELGIPYDNQSIGYDTAWADDMVTLRDGLAKFKNKDEPLTSEELQILIDYAEDRMLSDEKLGGEESAMSTFGGIPVERANEFFNLGSYNEDGIMSWEQYLSATDEPNYFQDRAIRGNLRQDNEHMDPERIRIGTIHSAKGKEAETVILATDTTQTIVENMAEDTRGEPNKKVSDAERRVYYVGMSRASEKLILAEGLKNATQCIPIDALLGDEATRQQTVEEVQETNDNDDEQEKWSDGVNTDIEVK